MMFGSECLSVSCRSGRWRLSIVTCSTWSCWCDLLGFAGIRLECEDGSAIFFKPVHPRVVGSSSCVHGECSALFLTLLPSTLFFKYPERNLFPQPNFPGKKSARKPRRWLSLGGIAVRRRLSLLLYRTSCVCWGD